MRMLGLESGAPSARNVGWPHRAAPCMAVLLLAAATASAAPELGTILPRGAARGGEAVVQFHGTKLDGPLDVVFHDPGIELAALEAVDDRRVDATLRIADDAPMGTHAMRLRTRAGLTNMKLFSVGALKEIEEEAPNDVFDEAQRIPLDVTVNGAITREDVDYYAIELEEGQRVAVEIEAMRLGGALFDPKLQFFAPTGHELFAEDDTPLFRQDAGFVYVAEASGEYRVAVSDSAYGGANNFRYRLHVGTFPRPFAVTPWGGPPGAEMEVRFLGDPALESQTITVPNAAPGTVMLPVLHDGAAAPTNMPFRVMDLPNTLEAEPNNALDEATEAVAPGAFEGVIDPPGDVDVFRFEGKEGQVLDFRVWAHTLGSPLDPVLTLMDSERKQLAHDVDGAGMLDSGFRHTLPADGTYYVRVHDHLRRGGPTFAYRIEVTAPDQGLNAAILENESVTLVVPRGNRAPVLLSVRRRGFDGPIAVDFADLPEGVQAAGETVPAGQGARPFVISAAADAPLGHALADLRVRHDVEDGLTGGLRQEIPLIEGRNRTVFYAREVDRLAVAVVEEAPFRIEAAPPAIPVVHRGHLMLEVRAERAEGFDGEISLRVPWLPNGFGAGTAKIAGDGDSAAIRLECQPAAAVGTHQLMIEAKAAGYVLASGLVTVEVEQPWVEFDVANVETERGAPVDLVVTPTFTREFDGEFEAALRGLPNGVTTAPLTFSHGAGDLVFPLEVAEDARAGTYKNLSIVTAIDLGAGPTPHVGGAGQLRIFDPLPEELQQAEPPPEDPEAPPRRSRFSSS